MSEGMDITGSGQGNIFLIFQGGTVKEAATTVSFVTDAYHIDYYIFFYHTHLIIPLMGEQD